MIQYCFHQMIFHIKFKEKFYFSYEKVLVKQKLKQSEVVQLVCVEGEKPFQLVKLVPVG